MNQPILFQIFIHTHKELISCIVQRLILGENLAVRKFNKAYKFRWSRGLGFNPWSRHTKDFKNFT